MSRFYILFRRIDGVGLESFFDYFGPDNPLFVILLPTLFLFKFNDGCNKDVISWILIKYEFISIAKAFIFVSDVYMHLLIDPEF